MNIKITINSLLTITLFVLTVLPVLASAQTPKVFESSFYTMNAPENWSLVTGELNESELRKLPQNLRDQYNAQTTDVMFVNLNDATLKDEDFKDSINTVIIDEKIAVSDESLNALKTVLEQQYQQIFENFKLKKMQIRTIKDTPAFEIIAEYKILNYELQLQQYLIPSTEKSLVITCTYDIQRQEQLSKICNDTLEALNFK